MQYNLQLVLTISGYINDHDLPYQPSCFSKAAFLFGAVKY